MTDNKKVYIWIFALFMVFYAMFRIATPAGWDEAFYLSQVSSALVDGDLMLQNDILMFKNPIDERIRAIKLLNKEGFHLNAFSIGPALFFSMPLMPLMDPEGKRFSEECMGSIALWTALFWFFGLVALYSILQLTEVGLNAKFLAILATLFSTPILLYGTRFYLSAHYLSTILIIFCLYFWIRWFQTPTYLWAWAMGLSSGFLVITRWESGIFFVSILWPLFLALRDPSQRSKRLVGLAIGIASGLLVVMVQLSAWNIQFGHWLLMPQGEGFMLWKSPAMIKFLISGYHGLIPWSPGLLVGFIGLIVAGRTLENPILKQLIPGLLVFFVLQYYISAAAWDWWGGCSYGPRRMCLLLGPVTLGWAVLLNRTRGWWKFVPVLVVILWGGFTMSAFRWQVDDTTLLLTGYPDPYRPDQDPITPEKIQNRWEDWHNGYRHWIKPGFSMKHRPRTPHRRSGFFILLGILGLGELLRRGWHKSSIFKLVTLGIVTGYIVMVICVLEFKFTPNKVWKDHWRGVSLNRPVPAPSEDFPRGYMAAVRVITTVNYLKGIQNGQTYDQDYLYDNSLPGITLEALIDYSKQ